MYLHLRFLLFLSILWIETSANNWDVNGIVGDDFTDSAGNDGWVAWPDADPYDEFVFKNYTVSIQGLADGSGTVKTAEDYYRNQCITNCLEN